MGTRNHRPPYRQSRLATWWDSWDADRTVAAIASLLAGGMVLYVTAHLIGWWMNNG